MSSENGVDRPQLTEYIAGSLVRELLPKHQYRMLEYLPHVSKT